MKLLAFVVFFLLSHNLMAADTVQMHPDVKILDSMDGWVSDELRLEGKVVKLYFELTGPTDLSPTTEGALGVSYGNAMDSVLGSFELVATGGNRVLVFSLIDSNKKLRLNYELKDGVLVLKLKDVDWPRFGKVSGIFRFYKSK